MKPRIYMKSAAFIKKGNHTPRHVTLITENNCSSYRYIKTAGANDVKNISLTQQNKVDGYNRR